MSSSRTTASGLPIEPRVVAFIFNHRVARLATADAQGRPHAVPICYAFDGSYIFSALDLKPKRVAGTELKRVRNIRANPQVAIVIDDYSEEWNTLAYVLVQGEAVILEEGSERSQAETMLRAKYPQYVRLLEPDCTVLKVTPHKVTGWGRL